MWDLRGSAGTSASQCRNDHEELSSAQGDSSFKHVCLGGGTEPAFSHDYDKEYNDTGTYRCACCGAPLFPAASKFNSGTGWPSFTAPVEGAIGYRKDLAQLGSTEVHCSSCGAHLGHVFDDGPRPTGYRYCINGVCLWRDGALERPAFKRLPWVVNAYLFFGIFIGAVVGCCCLSYFMGTVAWRHRDIFARGQKISSCGNVEPC